MIGLAFSGGKDSWACLQHYKEQLADIIVLWVNTGKNYPEALDSINLAKSMCPNFVEITIDREAQNALNGLPADIVPIANTAFGQGVTGKQKITIQSYFQCCYENISAPLNAKVKELGITTLISGKRNDEGHLSSCSDGQLLDGVTHIHPIEKWSSQDVLSYLSSKMEVPEHFKLSHSSLDCYDCSAYLKDTKDILEWSKKYPELHDKKVIRINQLKAVLTESMKDM